MASKLLKRDKNGHVSFTEANKGFIICFILKFDIYFVRKQRPMCFSYYQARGSLALSWLSCRRGGVGKAIILH